VVDLAVIEYSQRAPVRVENGDLPFGQPTSAIREGILRENPDLLLILGQRHLPAVARNGHLQSGGKDDARLHRRNPQRDLPTDRRLVLRLNRPFAPRDDLVLNGESPRRPPGHPCPGAASNVNLVSVSPNTADQDSHGRIITPSSAAAASAN